MTATIARIQQLSPERFVSDYVTRNEPVIVTDALEDWLWAERWTPEYLNRHFGHEPVQVYNDYFDLLDVSTLSEYWQRYCRDASPAPGSFVPYVRWYAKFRDVDFVWADAVFDRLRDNWRRPYFLPADDYLLPFAPAPLTVDPTIDSFPAKALFVSGPGARTGLHVDPWNSDAVLCQLFGEKTWLMYAPDQAHEVMASGRCVDPDHPDGALFPNFSNVLPRYVFSLRPGETVYVPHGWFHHVRSETTSLSVSWNFVHAAAADTFLEWLAGDPSDQDLSVLRYFFRAAVPDGAIAGIRDAVVSALRRQSDPA
jgi:Cupin-like domain